MSGNIMIYRFFFATFDLLAGEEKSFSQSGHWQ